MIGKVNCLENKTSGNKKSWLAPLRILEKIIKAEEEKKSEFLEDEETIMQLNALDINLPEIFEKADPPTPPMIENVNFELDYVEASQNFQGNYQNYVSRVLESIVPIRFINFSDILEKNKIFLPENSLNRKTLILDLDETLIHADFDNNFSEDTYDHLVTFSYEGRNVEVPIILRPGVNQFLQNISENFEVFVFTASKREYADAVLNILDPENKIFAKRFYRENCKPENIIIVDNSMYSFSNQLSNGILINSFYNDRDDRELFNLFNYLQQYIKNAQDSREVNEKIFNFDMILREYSVKRN
jgi:hypothetical protein